MDIVSAFEQVGSYRAAAELCGTTHKTVRRVIEARASGRPFEAARGRAAARNTDGVRGVIAERVRSSDGRISAKRLLPVAQAAGYAGSARNFRRAVAAAKSDWRRQRRVYRPWQPTPGEHLVMDWTPVADGWQVFCAVLAWSRWRFVRLARDQRAAITMGFLAECFEELGGVPAVVLTDRMGCLKGAVVANVMVPTPEYVRFATHFGFRPDFCEAADPESKGMVEALCRYVQVDLVVPSGAVAPRMKPTPQPGRGVLRSTGSSTVRAWRSRPNAWSSSETCCGRCPICGRGCAGARAARSTSCPRCGSARPAIRCPASWSAARSR